MGGLENTVVLRSIPLGFSFFIESMSLCSVSNRAYSHSCNLILQVLHHFFLSFHPPYRQVKLPNNPKPGVELFLLDSFPPELLPLSDSELLFFDILSSIAFISSDEVRFFSTCIFSCIGSCPCALVSYIRIYEMPKAISTGLFSTFIVAITLFVAVSITDTLLLS